MHVNNTIVHIDIVSCNINNKFILEATPKQWGCETDLTSMSLTKTEKQSKLKKREMRSVKSTVLRSTRKSLQSISL